MPIASDETVARFKARIATRKQAPVARAPVDRMAEYRNRFGFQGSSDPRAESMIVYKKALDTVCRKLKANPYRSEIIAKVCREFKVDPSETQYQHLIQAIVEGEAYLRLVEQIRNPKPESKEQ